MYINRFMKNECKPIWKFFLVWLNKKRKEYYFSNLTNITRQISIENLFKLYFSHVHFLLTSILGHVKCHFIGWYLFFKLWTIRNYFLLAILLMPPFSLSRAQTHSLVERCLDKTESRGKREFEKIKKKDHFSEEFCENKKCSHKSDSHEKSHFRSCFFLIFHRKQVSQYEQYTNFDWEVSSNDQ